MWLDLNIMTYILKKVGKHVSYLVVPPMDETPLHTRHGMMDIIFLATGT
jgi:hypothetical protein